MMEWMEKKSFSGVDRQEYIHKIRDYAVHKLESHFETVEISDHSGVRHCFLLDNGFLAHVQSMNGGAIYDLVIEYSENEDQMRVYDTEDGELFPVNDPSVFETVDDLVDAMLDEMKRTGESN